MGRIKTKLIRRLTFEVMKNGGDRLTKDFTENKAVVAQLLGDASNKLRNCIAGYATRLMKHKEE